MGQDPEAIRREIEETRERMGDTVEALGYKADVPTRTKEAVTDKVTAAKERITGAAGSVNESTPSTGDVKQAARRGAGMAQENPIGLAIGSIAVGFLAGMLIPGTRVENEKLGPVADQVKETAMQTGQEALEHGKQVAQEVGSSAQEHVGQAVNEVKDTAQQAAQEHGEQVKQSAADNAQDVREQVRP
jgi:gas vesicle protein